MSDVQFDNRLVPIANFDVHGPGDITAFMVIESELAQLGEQSDEARDANSFFFGCGGVLGGALLSLFASRPSGYWAVGFYTIIVVLFVFTLWFLVKWRRALTKQKTLMEQIRSRPRLFSAPMMAGTPARTN